MGINLGLSRTGRKSHNIQHISIILGSAGQLELHITHTTFLFSGILGLCQAN